VAPTVKFRPDQPLFKADAFRMPLWIHAPFEVCRGFVKWMAVSLHADNPHSNVMHNATFTRGASAPHRNAFWSGRPVVKGPKWRVMVWRWGVVFCVLAFIKYAPLSAWLWVARRLGDTLKLIGDVTVWAWANWGWLPLILVSTLAGVWAATHAVRVGVAALKERLRNGHERSEWYVYVLAIRDQVRGWFA